MSLNKVLKELESLGTEQNKKVYKRHGAGEILFGVSFKNIRTLEKKYKGDQALAEALWKTENSDAQTLAILIADSKSIKKSTLVSWQKSITYYMLSDLLAELVSKTNHADDLLVRWLNVKDEYSQAIAYSLICSMLKNGNHLEISFLEKEIGNIAKKIHSSANRAKHSMNMALISIGIYIDELEPLVVKAAQKIGKITVDHGETGCKTPDIIPYIERAKQRAKKKKAKAAN